MQIKTLVTIVVSVLGTVALLAIAFGAYILVMRYNDAIRTKTEVVDSIKKASNSCQDEGASLVIVPQGDNLLAQCIKLVQTTSIKQ